jgi:dynein heavy chain
MDLTISIQQMNKMVSEFDQLPWQLLNYQIAEANYGGRVTDPRDRRLLSVILSEFLNDNAFSETFKYSTDDRYYCP